jgi:4-alpha-glucanotransferase
MRAKRDVLEILAEEFFENATPARRAEFDAFLDEKPRTESYARFRAAVENGRWPGEAPPDGLIERRDEEAKGRRYHLFVQWQCERQLEAVAALARSTGFGLYLDVPLGVHGGGYDAWAERDIFARGVATGAPPDPFFTGGQNWGAPPPHPEALRRTGYRYFIESLRAIMRYAGILRFDHVMALHRLYWIPQGMPADQGVYVRYATEENFAILAIESHRHRTTVIGEDLGTVPEVVRSRMRRHAVRGMYVLQYEIGPHTVPREPSPESVASLNTHDMPPFAGFVLGEDIAVRAEHGHVDDVDAQSGERERTRATLGRFLHEHGLAAGDGTADLFEGATGFLANSRAEIVLVNLEDLWQTTEAQNLPGTHMEHPNWRRRLARPIEDLKQDPALAGRLAALDARRRQGGNE